MKTWKKLFALLMAMTMLLSLCACGGNSNSGDEGSVLRIGMDGEPLTLSEVDLAGGVGVQFVGWAIYGSLWKITTDGTVQMLLAESYDLDEENLTCTIHLRDTGFNNGDALTADDVLFSLKRSDEAMGDRTATMDLENSYVEDDQTLVIKLTSVPPTLVDDIGVISIISQSWTEDYTNEDHIYNDPLCCGPYYVESGWTSGNDMVLLKNENYYNADNIAYDKIVVSFVAEETTRYLSFKNGEYDICYLSVSENIEDVNASDSYNLFSAEVQSVEALTFDTENPNSPYSNQNLRLAMMYAVDVESVVTNICGSAYPVATSILPTLSWAYKDMSYGQDLNLAKQYIDAYYAETGTDSATITITYGQGDVDAAIAEALQYAFESVDDGITVVIDEEDFGTFFENMMNNSIYCYLTKYSGSSDPGSVLNCWNPENIYTMFSYPDDISQLFTTGVFTAGEQEDRTELIYELQDALHDFGKLLPLFENTVNFAIAGDIDISRSVQADGYLIPDFIVAG